jgi:DivIVA domain-containing protein
VPIAPEEIAGKEFLAVGGGYDEGEVRAFLRALADEHQILIEQLAERESIDDGQPGEEVARILDSAREAAEELLAKAEQVAADRVAAADKEATLTRDSVAASTDTLKREADEYSERTRRAADLDAQERLTETTRRVEQLLLGESRVRELLYSLEVILPEIREDLLAAERDILDGVDRTIVLDETPPAVEATSELEDEQAAASARL